MLKMVIARELFEDEDTNNIEVTKLVVGYNKIMFKFMRDAEEVTVVVNKRWNDPTTNTVKPYRVMVDGEELVMAGEDFKPIFKGFTKDELVDYYKNEYRVRRRANAEGVTFEQAKTEYEAEDAELDAFIANNCTGA